MAKLNHYLIAGSVISALISILHAVLVFKPELYRYISAGQESELARMADQGATFTFALPAV